MVLIQPQSLIAGRKRTLLMSNIRSKIKSAGLLLALFLFAIALDACARKSPKAEVDPATYAKEISGWQEKRWTDLKSENGWLTLVGLFWLKEGENKFGSDAANAIVLRKDKVSAKAGSFWLKNGVVTLQATE